MRTGELNILELNILAISGSLRAASLNTALLRAAQKHAPTGMSIGLYDGLGDLPHYNGDLDDERSLPAQVARLREVIAAADGLLIATPEYNYSVPGVLKNALDWASRPKTGSSLEGKHIAIMGASPGNFGTVRSQLALRQIFVATRSATVVHPETLVFAAHERFDQAGNLTDEITIGLLREITEALRDQILGARTAR
jgi:chromate reductase